MESVDDIIQSSAPLPGPTPDLCLEAQEEDWQAASAPSERLKLFHHMISNEKNYYVYLPEVDVMYKAGSTLEEVFQGSKEYKDHSIPDDGSWEYEEGPGWTGRDITGISKCGQQRQTLLANGSRHGKLNHLFHQMPRRKEDGKE